MPNKYKRKLSLILVIVYSISVFVCCGAGYALQANEHTLRPSSAAYTLKESQLFSSSHVGNKIISLGTAFLPEEKAGIFEDIIGLPVSGQSLGLSIQDDSGTVIEITIPLVDDFHLRILLLESMFYWLKEKGLLAINIDFLSTRSSDYQHILTELKHIWNIKGYEYQPSMEYPFRLAGTELQLRALALIEMAEQETVKGLDISRQRAALMPAADNRKAPRVLIISSSAEDPVVTSNKREGRFIAPGFGHHRLKAHMENNDYAEVDVFNPEVYENNAVAMNALVSRLIDRQYSIIGFSPTHSNLINDLRIAWLVKKISNHIGSDAIFVVGGNEATYDPESLLQGGPFDMALLGYGENNLTELTQLIRAGQGKALSVVLDKMDGVAYIDEKGDFVSTFPSAITAEEFQQYNFDNRPFDEMPYTMHWIHSAMSMSPSNIKTRKSSLRCARVFFTTHCAKGTPCGFCANWLVRSQKLLGLTGRQAAEIVRQAVLLHGAESVYINDDDMLMGGSVPGKRRFREFCEELIRMKQKREIPGEFVLHMQTRSTSFLKTNPLTGIYEPDSALIGLAKRAGFGIIALGVETFSDRLLTADSIRKVTPSEHDHLKRLEIQPSDIHKLAIEGLLDAGLTPQINLIGLPPEIQVEDLAVTIETSMEYVKRGAQLALTTYVWYVPGSSLAIQEKRKIESGQPSSLEVRDITIPGTDIAYRYYNRYRPMSPDIFQITETGNIWKRADSIWENIVDYIEKDGLAVDTEDPPLQVRVLTIFASELELLVEYLSSQDRHDEALALAGLSEKVTESVSKFVRQNLTSNQADIDSIPEIPPAGRFRDHNSIYAEIASAA